ncbi:hypothetical protein ACVBEF_01555 [Glaciimonas sp. GG7]
MNTFAVFLPDDVQSALASLLSSKGFYKSQRSSRLLRFLVEQALAGDARETSEYAIGISVFDRDVATYSTGDDPIVRVQIGRLREKLKIHYATPNAHTDLDTDLKFSIPAGSYMPVIEKKTDPTLHLKMPFSDNLLIVVPLRILSPDVQSTASCPTPSMCTNGLNEELTFQLFHTFGDKVIPHTFGSAAVIRPKVGHLLEGSIRVDGDLIRASLRLIDVSAGCIVWSEQFDDNLPFGISSQEHLAMAICHALRKYLSHGEAPV